MNRANNNPTDGNGTKFLITGLITGGILGYVFTRSYLNVKRNHEERNDSVDENEIEDNSAKDGKIKFKSKPEEQKIEDLGILDMLHDYLIENILYEKGDIIVVDQEETDVDEGIDKRYIQYTYVSETEPKDGNDGYISIIIKLEDELLSKNRNKRIKDPSYDKIKNYVSDILNSKFEYRKIGHSSKPIGFYFFNDEGINESKIELKELRELESICGFRYIEFRFYNLNRDKRVGTRFLGEILDGFHPRGGEEDNDMDFMPIILDRTEDGIFMSEDNNVVSDFLRRDSRVITNGEE